MTTTNSDDSFQNSKDVHYLELDLLKAIKRPWWHDQSLCITENASLLEFFFPESGTHGGNHLAPARKICMNCNVRYECLVYGLDEQWGVWGGHSPSQRRKISALVKKGSSLIEASEAIDARSRDAR